MECEINKLLAECVNKVDPTILDIGANDGMTALSFKKIFPNSVIHCFEPDIRAYHRAVALCSNVKDLFIHQIAISRLDGVQNFYKSNGHHPKDMALMAGRPMGWDLSGSLHKPRLHLKENPWVLFDEIVKVQTRSLDSWAKENRIGNVDLIWMDVQGAEADVLKGGKNVVKESRFIFTEYFDYELYYEQPSLREIMDLLPGFSLLKKYEHDALLENNSTRIVF